jgi:ribonuclease HII
MDRTGQAPAAGDEPVAAPHLLFEERLWRRGLRWVAGADEVGRGPLAGPVVAAAVVLPRGVEASVLSGVDDSKRLRPDARERLALTIRRVAVAWSVAEVEAAEIDRLNILVASHEAIRRAVEGLPLPVEHALIDGLPNPCLRRPHTALVGGDALCLSVAAASILAKVHRDGVMAALDGRYPGYGFARHKGYPTPEHRAALQLLGPCPLHRRSFRWEGAAGWSAAAETVAE